MRAGVSFEKRSVDLTGPDYQFNQFSKVFLLGPRSDDSQELRHPADICDRQAVVRNNPDVTILEI